MTTNTVATRPDVPAAEIAADTLARMFRTADDIRDLPAEHRAAALSLFLVDAHLLTRLLGNAHGRPDHEEIADRLWMVCATPLEIHNLAVIASASCQEKLIDDQDGLDLARAGMRALRGAR